MTETRIPDAPLMLPVKGVDQITKEELKTAVKEEAQVVVHCTFYSQRADAIRVWKSTFLIAKDSCHRSKLSHAENITLNPVWMKVLPGSTVCFTLFFTPLPKNCRQFDLLEVIPQAGGFEVRNIIRNSMDVYSVRFH